MTDASSVRAAHTSRPLRVLIATAWLGDRRGGTELFALDVAGELLRRGHQPVIFSPTLGSVAEEARAAGIQTVATPGDLAEPPDLIHGQHHVETMTALLHFPRVPAVFFSMSARFWTDAPPRHPRVRRYVALDQPTHERLTLEAGVDPSMVHTVNNFVDLRKFLRRSALPTRPRRALVFSNYASERSHLPSVRAACEQRGIELDVLGAEAGRQSNQPERLLGQYDLVFAKSRAAIESMAVGAATVVCDFDGVGPLVTLANLGELRALNFGYRVQTQPHSPEAVAEQIDRYDPDDARAVCERIRAEAGLDRAVDTIERIYRQALSEPVSLPLEVEMQAASAYVHWLNPFLRERDQTRAWVERLLEIAEERGQRIQDLTTECERRLAWAEGLLSEAGQRGTVIKEQQQAAEMLRQTVQERTAWAENLLEGAGRQAEVIRQLEDALAERTARAESIQSEAQRRSRLIETLHSAVESLQLAIQERTAWAEGLLQAAERRAEAIGELQRALAESTARADRIGSEAERRGKVIETLERAVDALRQTVDERTAWAEQLLKVAEERGALVERLHQALET